MNKSKLFSALLIIGSSLTITSCGPTIKTTGSWVNREKIPAEPIKSVFVVAFTDNMDVRLHLEENIAEAAKKKGLKAYKSTDIIGTVEMKYVAPVKDVFLKKLHDLNCEAIFTVALVDAVSETKYVPGTTASYSPYAYGAYGGYSGYGAYGPYGGFGGYYGYAISTVSTPGYYQTDNEYFIEAKLFDVKTDDLLLSIQSKAKNPAEIAKASKQYTESLMEEIKRMRLRKK
jgi:hypothetical protein